MSTSWLEGRNNEAEKTAITSLLFPATSWVTGAVWNVDGGVMARHN